MGKGRGTLRRIATYGSGARKEAFSLGISVGGERALRRRGVREIERTNRRHTTYRAMVKKR